MNPQKSLLFKVTFTIDRIRYELLAGDIDMTHPYFVCLKQFEWKSRSETFALPTEDEARKRFEHCKLVYVPSQHVISIEGLDREEYFTVNQPKRAVVTTI